MRGVACFSIGVGVLGVHFLLLLLLELQHQTVHSVPFDEDSKSLWHVMAQSLLIVEPGDRNRFLLVCLKQRVRCDLSHFEGPDAFKWREDVKDGSKIRFWSAYRCVYHENLTQCPVDGDWSSWSPWSSCSATCDASGNETRTRTCSNPVPLRGGQHCHGSTLRIRPCLGLCQDSGRTDRGGMESAEAFLKQVHEAYPSLVHDCFNAHCTYGVVQRVINEKFVMAKYWSTLICVKYGGACPVDGQWGQWSSWSSCSLKCGSGSSTRTRICDSPQPAFAGHPCRGEFYEQISCIMRDCGMTSTETFTEWTKWTPCSVSCGGFGVQKSSRVCLRHAGCDLQGVLTPYVNRSRPCNAGDCPTQGGWSEWSEWTDCTAACGVGRQSRMRICDSPYPAGGLVCLGDQVDFRLCKGQTCAGQPPPPVNTGFVIRKDDATVEDVKLGRGEQYGGLPLNPALESIYTPWSPWSSCQATCGQGLRTRKRWCSALTTPMPPCEGEVRQIQFCNVFVCPMAGGWGSWLPWTPCSTTCGMGKRQRYRECSSPMPQFGGACLGDTSRMEDCDMGQCPHLSGGTWTPWSPWTDCTATCGGGKRARNRARQRYTGTASNSSSGVPILEKVPPETYNLGTQEVLECNAQPCPVDGGWAEWGDWSRCTVPCGLGRRMRDRTCTDPSPIFGGDVCQGPGTDLIHCFAGPCKDLEDRAIYLGPSSWIRFAPHNRPSRFLVLYLHFKPLNPHGTILRRYRQCRSIFDDDVGKEEGGQGSGQGDTREEQRENEADRQADEDSSCQLVVVLKMENSKVILYVLARGAALDIQYPAALALGMWHEILIEVLKTGASMRVDNMDRIFANFSRPLFKDLDFDSYMILGAFDNKTTGLNCSICSVSVNFRTQDLFATTDWQGTGTPVGRHTVSVHSINPSVQLPHFKGLYYCPIRLFHAERLSVRLTMALDGGDGLLLFSPGEAQGTMMTLGIRNSRLVLCLLCHQAGRLLCHHGDTLKMHQWYHVAVLVDGREAELRVDQGKANQLTCTGLPFKPRKILFIGGRSATVWAEVQQLTNYTDGFFGVLGTVVVNGRTLPFRHAVLMGRDDRINLDGYSRASRVTPVFEHKNSIVMLRCQVDQVVDNATEIKVIWLLRDTVLEPTPLVEIIKPIGLVNRVGTLQLKPGGHSEGIYACVVSRDGRLELQHVFPVFRHAAKPDLYEGRMEWILLKVLLILLPVLALGCIVYKFKDWLFKLFGKRRKRQEPLLATEQTELWKPEKIHLSGADPQSDWDNYLHQQEGGLQEVNAVSFGDDGSRHLPETPGVSSERTIQVSNFGQVKLGDDPRHTTTIRFQSPENLGEPGMQSDPVYANLTQNRPWVSFLGPLFSLGRNRKSRPQNRAALSTSRGVGKHKKRASRFQSRSCSRSGMLRGDNGDTRYSRKAGSRSKSRSGSRVRSTSQAGRRGRRPSQSPCRRQASSRKSSASPRSKGGYSVDGCGRSRSQTPSGTHRDPSKQLRKPRVTFPGEPPILDRRRQIDGGGCEGRGSDGSSAKHQVYLIRRHSSDVTRKDRRRRRKARCLRKQK